MEFPFGVCRFPDFSCGVRDPLGGLWVWVDLGGVQLAEGLGFAFSVWAGG